MKDLEQLEKRLKELQQECEEYIRCHVRKSGRYYSYDPGSIDEINKFYRKIYNVKTNINQVKMKIMNKSRGSV